jgi:hypothetical protein
VKHSCFVILILIESLAALAQVADQAVSNSNERDVIREELRRRTLQISQIQEAILLSPKIKPKAGAYLSADLLGNQASVPNEGLKNLRLLTDSQLIKRLLEFDNKIYRNIGKDDRVETRQAIESTNLALKRLTLQYHDAVAALFVVDDLKDNGDGTSTILTTQTLAQREKLCQGARFADEPVVAFGTAFLIRSNLLATAGHCIYDTRAPNIVQIRAVFGWECDSRGKTPTVLSNSNIFKVSLLQAEFKGNGDSSDWAILTLERAIERPVFKLRTQGKVSDKTEVVSFGYPSGLPLKVAGAAVVNINTNVNTFTSSLDVYAGNSGSPVLNLDGVVEGIVASGGVDYVLNRDKNCYTPLEVPDTGLRGFYCTRITLLSAHLP